MPENKIKRHFYKNVDYKINYETKTVELLPEFHKKLQDKKLWGRFGFKKIGGSSIGDVLLSDNYKSQFVAFCRMSWIGLPILDRKYVDAGIAIEPKVIDVIKKISKKEVLTYDPYKYNFDFFADKDDVVGGLPDGYIPETKTVIEIKTTGGKNYDKWKTYGVPKAYLEQAELYAYLMGVENYSIVATFLEEEDYLNPENYPIEKRRTKNWLFKVDKAASEDKINKVKEWYYEHVKTGVSPKFNESKDAELLEWLECSDVNEWEYLKNKWIQSGKIVI